MNRNTIIALVALFGIAAGTFVWRYYQQQEAAARQERLVAVLERTEGNAGERIVALDSILAAYPQAEDVQRIARHHLLQAHADAGSSADLLRDVAHAYLAADSSWWAKFSVASVYSGRGVNAAEGMVFIAESEHEVMQMQAPDRMSAENWADQQREMLGYCRNIAGKLQAAQGSLTVALPLLAAAVDSVPDSYEFRVDLARAYESAGDTRAAVNEFMGVVRLKYDEAEARAAVERLYPLVYRRPAVGVLDTLVQNARAARRREMLAVVDTTAAPAFEVPGLDGRTYTRDSLRGRVVIMDIWATWCGPCRRKLPQLQRAYELFGARPDVAFLAVSVDEDAAMASSFIEQFGYTFPVAHGGPDFGREFGVEGIPTLFVIDRAGVIRFEELGYNDAGDFVEELGWKIDAALAFPSDSPGVVGSAVP